MLASCEYCSYETWRCKDALGEFTVKGYTAVRLNPAQNVNINEVVLHNQEVNHFPRCFGSFFPRLKRLVIISCGLTTISREDLIGLEELEHLAVTFNLLTSLPSNLFIGMTQLKSITFKDNKLKKMSSKLLEPILENGLTLIDFRGNSKIDAFYSVCDNESVSLERLMELIDTGCDKAEGNQGQVSTIESLKGVFIAGLANLWESGEHSDFTIIANDSKEFRVHKTVLAIQSPVFAAMFKNDVKGRQAGKMTISEFSAESVEQFLGCLYTGEIKNVTNAIELFALAAMYDVAELKIASEENVLTNISKLNAFDVLVSGHRYSSIVMQRKSFMYIKQTFKDIKLDDELLNDPEQLKVLIDADKSRKRKIQDAENEFASVCKLSKLKLNKTM